ncbi:MAG TPA: transporter substrate-binding domain-containing protein [Roseiflexaceae bacterium]|nr:transporter substrate-binding domain-containing protein [Roseiflexaceae bacterium]
MRKLQIWIVAMVVAGALGAPVAAIAALGAAPPMPQPTTLRVVTKPLEPFVIEQNDQLNGFSVDLWNQIAGRLNLKYEWVEVASVTDQLEAVQTGAADVAIAGISMTAEREQLVDFSHPYFTSGLQILISTKNESMLSSTGRFLAAFAPALLTYLGIAMLIALALAHLVWLVERRTNPDFQRGYLSGLWEATWWLLNIVANGEYGDKATRSPLKRLLTIALWLIGVSLIAQFTASITSALTVQQLGGAISGPAELPGKRVATLPGTTAAQYLTDHHIAFTAVPTIDEAYQLLARGTVQAVVYDAPVLLYYSVTRGKGSTRVVGPIFKEETYGIALPTGSPLRKPINEALLALRQDGTYDTIYSKWFRSAN